MGYGFARFSGVCIATHRHTKNSVSSKYHFKFIAHASNRSNKPFILPDDVFMREIVDLLEEGYFTDSGERHSFFAVYNSDSLQSHETAFVLKIAGLVDGAIRSIPDLGHFFVLLSHGSDFKAVQ